MCKTITTILTQYKVVQQNDNENILEKIIRHYHIMNEHLTSKTEKLKGTNHDTFFVRFCEYRFWNICIDAIIFNNVPDNWTSVSNGGFAKVWFYMFSI